MPEGTPLTAPMSGTIISAGNERWGGQVNELVYIGGKPYVLSWLHLKTVQVRPGPVKAGQQIGLSGTPPPGYGSGSHTHFEVTTGTVAPYMGYNPWHPTAESHPVNPAPFLALFKAGAFLGGSTGGLGGVADSVIGTGGVYNPTGQQDPGHVPHGGDCVHSISLFPGNTTCLDGGIDFAARGALVVSALVLLVMAFAIFAGGNADVRSAVGKIGKTAAEAA